MKTPLSSSIGMRKTAPFMYWGVAALLGGAVIGASMIVATKPAPKPAVSAPASKPKAPQQQAAAAGARPESFEEAKCPEEVSNGRGQPSARRWFVVDPNAATNKELKQSYLLNGDYKTQGDEVLKAVGCGTMPLTTWVYHSFEGGDMLMFGVTLVKEVRCDDYHLERVALDDVLERPAWCQKDGAPCLKEHWQRERDNISYGGTRISEDMIRSFVWQATWECTDEELFDAASPCRKRINAGLAAVTQAIPSLHNLCVRAKFHRQKPEK